MFSSRCSPPLAAILHKVLSITDIETDDQVLTAGDTNAAVDSEDSLADALKTRGGGVYGNYPVLTVSKRPAGARAMVQASAADSSGNVGTAAKPEQDAAQPPILEECCSRT